MGHRLPVRAQFTTRSTLATMNPLCSTSPVMPLMTASCSGPGGSASRFQAIAGAVVSFIWLLPFQSAFAPLIDEPDGQYGKAGGEHRGRFSQQQRVGSG